MSKVLLIILDSLGIGALPDAYKFGDEGTNTLKHITETINNVFLPNLERLGLGKIEKLNGISNKIEALGSYGKAASKTFGKDTISGHLEIAGFIPEKPFPVFNPIPPDIIEKFEAVIGRRTLGGGIPYSGTEIIKDLGQEHLKTGFPIVYTSADSVFQVAAHEDIIPVNQLYEMCLKARKLLVGEHSMGRVIARPFIGKVGNFSRTDRRKDFAFQPPENTLLDYLKDRNFDVIGIGKIPDIFASRGLTSSYPSENNLDAIESTKKVMQEDITGLIFTNLVDFDMLYGHRRDPEGYYRALKNFDSELPYFLDHIQIGDILIITADHGCDPTFTKTTDHTREYVPILVVGDKIKNDYDIGTRESFSDIGQTIAEFFNIKPLKIGKSFLKEILI